MGYRNTDYALEHPDITAIRTHGYPLDHLPIEQWCESCGNTIDEDVYYDDTHDNLCLGCLLSLHRKDLY